MNHHYDGPISEKVISAIQTLQGEKLVNLSEIRKAKLTAENFQKSILSQEEFAQLDPLHALYSYGQNQMSVLAEQLSALPMFSKISKLAVAAEDEYMPSGPPMSPLTMSYFSYWEFFDLSVGKKRESFGTVGISLYESLGVDIGLVNILRVMQQSYMGVFILEDCRHRVFRFRELITNNSIEAIVPSGYVGKKGEVWFCRILPPLQEILPMTYSIVLTTPYVVGMLERRGWSAKSAESLWKSYFDRHLKSGNEDDRKSAYRQLMKYGVETNYWNEYIFLGYCGYEKEVIFLAGVPDIPSSLPHADH